MGKSIMKTNKIDSQLLENLLKKTAEGDKKSFHKLYEILKGPIYGYSLSILKNHDDALDNMQEVFIKVYDSLENYKYQNKPMNWIFTITKNCALMKIRKDKKEQKQEIEKEQIINSSISEEDKIILKILIEVLSDEERQIMIMHLIGNLKHKEIAKILDLKLSTTLSKYHRAIKKLRLQWKEV